MEIDEFKNHYALYDKAFEKWGWQLQLVKTTEECGELIAECSQSFITSEIGEEFLQEMADVQIMLNQFKRFLQCKGVYSDYEKAFKNKIEKLERYLS